MPAPPDHARLAPGVAARSELKAWRGWPTRCALCRDWTRAPLCTACEGRFASQRVRCQRCALPLSTSAPHCGACLTHPPRWDAATCAEDYAFPWDGLIGELKFERRTERVRLLAGRLLQVLHEDPSAQAVDLVLPIPLSQARLRERGFNQAWEIARRVARGLRLPARADVLVRTMDTPPQAGLSRSARSTNLQGAFSVRPETRTVVDGCRVALVDDIMTTGATFAAACLALRKAGAATVSVWAVARTPEPTITPD